jgi:hypothetical protein
LLAKNARASTVPTSIGPLGKRAKASSSATSF